jgi:hypothetical protein
MLTEGADLSREEAARIRENYMALQAKLQYEKDSGQTIEWPSPRRFFSTPFANSVMPG